MWTWLFRHMTELGSRKWISRLTGSFAKSRASRGFIPRFARTYGIRTEEAERAIQEYATLNEFFTRRLKPGMRPVDDTADMAVSPVDALVTGAGPIQDGTMLGIKGQDYTVEELLNGSPRIQNYRNGYYAVLYLSPTDYHRIHVPADGVIVEREHLPGRVYPVNEFGLTRMRRVLSRNERLVTYMTHNGGEIAIVKVGALNVSSIRYTEPQTADVRRGDELAYFEFGSTVVLLFEDGTFEPRTDLAVGLKVKMGEQLGKLSTT
ncbi:MULTISPECIES: archaetidylserine decarboxylase [unclassified Paenibacillus]|uniref:archaetidylserine decarboxylase n=1 Tax=unclassified Paenibacillus TaxID=185978 RepID=UPI0009557E20|nr:MULTISPECIES: archaetidylserine decarboxylase [unclassified Paenibacillus]ASS68967.1 phosphatidylserine decarboxylase [Paenibacillus sp. RUD330]SIR12833.1 phosphatidylserine decarboxylase [Paenibacillus sp. RU4X]SIR24561.1 phosphatidylserine decarboxylase [Paenibacillus sp. RU4T]